VQAIRAARDASQLYCLDKAAERAMVARIEQAMKDGDSVGGVFEVAAFGVPPGLGSCAQWTQRLDGRLAQALMAIQAIKGVEIGLGFRAASLPGSQVHDEILFEAGSFKRASNNAGGIEGGMSNGEPIVARAAMKPIPTLRKPLRSVDLKTKQPVTAAVERSDVCAVPAASVVGEAVVAFEIAAAFLEKFGGDSLAEIERNCRSYLASLKNI
ncbi:MAG: chorismate synthase, partial [Planctomycetes bacterium]|nr:chorismate synthase [Planctomycetota bacterium]